MYAIVDCNGKQYQVEAGRYLEIDHVNLEENATLTFDKVQLIIDDGKTLVGAPYIVGASVKATVLKQIKGPKLLVFKMRRKKGYRRKNGHRQPYTRIQIDAINVG